MISKVYNKAVYMYLYSEAASVENVEYWLDLIYAHVLEVMRLCLWTLSCVLTGQQKEDKDNMF